MGCRRLVGDGEVVIAESVAADVARRSVPEHLSALAQIHELRSQLRDLVGDALERLQGVGLDTRIEVERIGSRRC
jgi:hypothetical protein